MPCALLWSGLAVWQELTGAAHATGDRAGPQSRSNKNIPRNDRHGGRSQNNGVTESIPERGWLFFPCQTCSHARNQPTWRDPAVQPCSPRPDAYSCHHGTGRELQLLRSCLHQCAIGTEADSRCEMGPGWLHSDVGRLPRRLHSGRLNT